MSDEYDPALGEISGLGVLQYREYRHKRKGAVYVVLGTVNTSVRNSEKFPWLVIYQERTLDKRVWARPIADFLAKTTLITEYTG